MEEHNCFKSLLCKSTWTISYAELRLEVIVRNKNQYEKNHRETYITLKTCSNLLRQNLKIELCESFHAKHKEIPESSLSNKLFLFWIYCLAPGKPQHNSDWNSWFISFSVKYFPIGHYCLQAWRQRNQQSRMHFFVIFCQWSKCQDL